MLEYILLICFSAFVLLLFTTAIINIFWRTPFVPTSQKTVRHIIKLANLQESETVYDLGCGDGRFLIAAQKKTQTTAMGYENAPIPWLLAQGRKLLTGANIQVSMKNFFKTSLADADVIFCYLGPEMMKKVGEKVKKECKPGTRLYSNTFSVPGMKPEKTWSKDPTQKLPTIHYYKI